MLYKTFGVHRARQAVDRNSLCLVVVFF